MMNKTLISHICDGDGSNKVERRMWTIAEMIGVYINRQIEQDQQP